MSNAWSDENAARVAKLDAQGMSESEISAFMGLTKNAIHWQRVKLGLVKKREPKAEAPHRSLSEKIRLGAFDFRRHGELPPEGAKSPKHYDLNDPSRSDGKTIEQSTRGCRWPIGGEGADTYFCCRQKARGSYCADHAKRAYTASQVSKEDESSLARMIRRAA